MNSKRLLIISNRVLSTTDNNGKTLYSFIKSKPKESVSQLYFYGNLPKIARYNYFQLSDKDIILGKFSKSLRGRKVEVEEHQNPEENICENTDILIQSKYKIPRNNMILLLREFIWNNSWKSKQLDKWLDEVNPDAIFFMAGDCLYAYQICAYVVKRFHCRLSVYITDDYVLPRHHESLLAKKRREMIANLMGKCVKHSQDFYTISERMRLEYKILFGKDSKVIFNMPESIYDKKLCKISEKNETIIFTYAGSLYYGRDRILLKLAKEIKKYNNCHKDRKKGRLYIYSNAKPEQKFVKELETVGIGTVVYGGSLSKEQLKEKLNLSNVLVFVESFEKEQIEKTQLSFSTKIPEYLSVGKPILAIGPEQIGSMDYLKDVAECIINEEEIYEKLVKLASSVEVQKEYSRRALDKYKQSCILFQPNKIF